MMGAEAMLSRRARGGAVHRAERCCEDEEGQRNNHGCTYTPIDAGDTPGNPIQVQAHQPGAMETQVFRPSASASAQSPAAPALTPPHPTPPPAPPKQGARGGTMWSAAMQRVDAGEVLVRKCRARQCGVAPGDTFLARVECFRLAGAELLKNERHRSVLKGAFKATCATILTNGGTDPSACMAAIDGLEAFIIAEFARDNGRRLLREMQARGIPEITVYDLALEFFLFDCFDMMETPPKVVEAACNSPWIPLNARQAGARQVIWKLTDRNRQQAEPGTYIQHFYEVAVELNPLLISGLLGAAPAPFVALCHAFKTAMDGWVTECFNLPGADESLDPVTYAAKIVAAAEIWMSLERITQIAPL